MIHDLSGEAVTIVGEEALSAWDATLEAVLAHAATAAAHLDRTLLADPGFALGHAARGLMLLTLARAELGAAAADALEAARKAAAARPVTAREAAHIEALRHWVAGSPSRAAATLEAVLVRHPHDVLALKLAHAIRFMLGDAAGMLKVLRRVAPAYGDGHPFAGYVAGCHAFALEETGFHAEAERTGRRAVRLSPRDAWGRHAVAHVMEMQGRTHEGVAWLSDGRTFAHANNFRFHMVWHLALFRLERGEAGEALRLYDEEIRAEKTDDFRDLANGASLLARLEFDGIDVGDRWEELADRAERRAADGRLVFADLHYTLALLGAGRRDAAETLAARIVADAGRHDSADRKRQARAGAPAALGLLAFSDGDYANAARLLGRARRELQAVGGSHAQRDVFEQAHAESLMRSGDHEAAARVLAARIERRGSNAFAARRLARIARRPAGRAAILALSAIPAAQGH